MLQLLVLLSKLNVLELRDLGLAFRFFHSETDLEILDPGGRFLAGEFFLNAVEFLVVFQRIAEVAVQFIRAGQSLMALVDPRFGFDFPGDLQGLGQGLDCLGGVTFVDRKISQIEQAGAFRLAAS